MRARREHPLLDRPRRHGRPVLSAAACPRCGRTHLRRSHRTDLIERLLGLVYYYPFRCQACGHRFWRMQWGTRYARVSTERRDFDRLPVRVPVTIVGTRGRIDAVATNISIQGCALELATQLPGAGPLGLTLHVPGGAPIEIAAARPRYEAGRVAGVEFRQMTPAAQTLLADYVSRLYGRTS